MWGCCEIEIFCDFGEIKFVNVVDGLEVVISVCVEVGFKGVGCVLLKVVFGVLVVDEFFELGLDVDDFIGWEFEFDDWDFGCFEVRKEVNFVGLLNVSFCIILKSNFVYDFYLEEE